MNKPRSTNTDRDFRRLVLFILASLFLCIGFLLRSVRFDESNHADAGISSVLVRIGVVFGALWLAWPSMGRLTRWLPPGVAVAIVLFLCAVAARPTLLPAFLLGFGLLGTITGLIRLVQKSSSDSPKR